VGLDDLLERESDIEELRRVAMALHAQLQHTIRQMLGAGANEAITLPKTGS
jgi:2,4-dienoyl-CoA reductase-like NADH-dependent reductase (Old Yellow Enzyme family)